MISKTDYDKYLELEDKVYEQASFTLDWYIKNIERMPAHESWYVEDMSNDNIHCEYSYPNMGGKENLNIPIELMFMGEQELKHYKIKYFAKSKIAEKQKLDDECKRMREVDKLDKEKRRKRYEELKNEFEEK